MSEIARVVSATPVINGVLKVVWDDGHEAVVDCRPIIAKGKAFAFLGSAHRFAAVEVGEHGSSVYWVDDEGRVVDLGALGLRETADMQAELLRYAS
ncbi:MAG: DUF2442 domain-containing protein [Ancalomicrobiaceae bacterium]|nr:DUF2442 domain-containing protein [Ancalomicrobiaceae bacterium]